MASKSVMQTRLIIQCTYHFRWLDKLEFQKENIAPVICWKQDFLWVKRQKLLESNQAMSLLIQFSHYKR